jgi:integrase/recombinase XerC
LRETALVEVLFATGMRVSEAVALNLTEVDTERLTISVRGKGNREREIPVACEAFRDVLAQYLADRSVQGAKSNDPLFVDRRCKRMSDQSVADQSLE